MAPVTSTMDIGLEALVADSTGSSGAWALAAGAVAVGALAATDREQERVIKSLTRMPMYVGGVADRVAFDVPTLEAFYDSQNSNAQRALSFLYGSPVAAPCFSSRDWYDWMKDWDSDQRLRCLEWLQDSPIQSLRSKARLYALHLEGKPFMDAEKKRADADLGDPPSVDITLYNLPIDQKKLGSNIGPLVRAMYEAYGYGDLVHELVPGECKLGPIDPNSFLGEGPTRRAQKVHGDGTGCEAFVYKCKGSPGQRFVVRGPPTLRSGMVTLKRVPVFGPQRTLHLHAYTRESSAWTPEVTALHEGEDQPRLLGKEYADQSDAHWAER